MICWFCKRPVVVPNAVDESNRVALTKALCSADEHMVRSTRQRINCPSCRTEYSVIVELVRSSVVSQPVLEIMKNDPVK